MCNVRCQFNALYPEVAELRKEKEGTIGYSWWFQDALGRAVRDHGWALMMEGEDEFDSPHCAPNRSKRPRPSPPPPTAPSDHGELVRASEVCCGWDTIEMRFTWPRAVAVPSAPRSPALHKAPAANVTRCRTTRRSRSRYGRALYAKYTCAMNAVGRIMSGWVVRGWRSVVHRRCERTICSLYKPLYKRCAAHMLRASAKAGQPRHFRVMIAHGVGPVGSNGSDRQRLLQLVRVCDKLSVKWTGARVPTKSRREVGG